MDHLKRACATQLCHLNTNSDITAVAGTSRSQLHCAHAADACYGLHCTREDAGPRATEQH